MTPSASARFDHVQATEPVSRGHGSSSGFLAAAPTLFRTFMFASANGTPVPLGAFAHFGPSNTAAGGQPPGTIPVGDFVVQPRTRRFFGAATNAIDTAQRAISFPPTINASFQGTAAAFQSSLSSEPLLILAALVTVYIVLGMLYESLYPSHHHSFHVAFGWCRRAAGVAVAKSELNVMGLIGIILLIGIVKKNAIMMIDFALETERKARVRRNRSTKPAFSASAPS